MGETRFAQTPPTRTASRSMYHSGRAQGRCAHRRRVNVLLDGPNRCPELLWSVSAAVVPRPTIFNDLIQQ
jgi:hypothetical protein